MEAKRLNIFLLYSMMLIPNTIANLAKASRTKYQSNQIGQFSANKIRTWIGMREQREKEQLAGRQAESREEKWFNLAVVLLEPSHQGKALFNFFVSFDQTVSWSGMVSCSVRWQELRCRQTTPLLQQKLLSHSASSSSNNTSEGRERDYKQAGCIMAFPSFSSTHAAFRPLPCVHMHVCACVCWRMLLGDGGSRSRLYLRKPQPHHRCL